MFKPKTCRSLFTMGVGLACCLPLFLRANEAQDQKVEINADDLEKVIVWGTRNPLSETSKGPNSKITPLDLASINVTSTEDLVKYESSIIIRKRFIGDSNGTMGIRGANMFQTSRSMVFADGVPLHYLLQTRWNGSPRWSLVAADEIAEIKISYGPFSAEYPGNSMGGVVNIETAIPTKRKFHADISTFQQGFSVLGFDENLMGYKGFVSYADNFGDLSVYASFNRLVNDGHPQSFYFSTDKDISNETITEVSGAYPDVNEYDEPAVYYGSSGVTEVVADQAKFKVAYSGNDWLSVVNVAFEDRSSKNQGLQNYILDSEGNAVWNGFVAQGDFEFEVESDDFAFGKSERKSFLIGGRTRGQFSDHWHVELSASYFDVLNDESFETNAHPDDPTFTGFYTLSKEYGDTGWITADVKIFNDNLYAVSGLKLLAGLHYDQYELEIVDSGGGQTNTQALFVQLDYQVNEQWAISLGGRYERWQSEEGFYINRGVYQAHPDRSSNYFSPKLTVEFSPLDWRLSYSLAKAYRFPIVEELFQNERTTRSRSIANAYLEPEDGLHHNLGLKHSLGSGSVTVNLFREQIKESIYSQTGNVGGTTLRTFLPVTEVTTNGADFTIQQYNIFDADVDLRFNATYLDSKITENDLNPALEGNDFPRMPKWRASFIATWHVNESWDIGGGIRYSVNSFGDLDNGDTAEEVFGAHDEFIFLNLKTSYVINDNTKLSLGLDNVTDEVAYVHHPWPRRTMFLELSLEY